MIITLTGASGFIGRGLIARLHQDGYTVRALGRNDPGIAGVEFVEWDAVRAEPAPEALRDAGAVIHLAGEPVAQRWTRDAKHRIRETRLAGTRNLVNAIGKLSSRPAVLISASAVGYYGDRGDEVLPESSGPGTGFLAEVCMEWERAARQAGAHGLRVSMLRTGIVLGTGGGALQQMIPPFRAGVGGRMGSGRQWVPWIHLDDVAELVVFALRHDHVFGPLNASAPEPVRNEEFAKTLGAALARPSMVPAPAFGLKLIFGEMASMLLASQRVIPAAVTRAGFAFKYPDLREALDQILTSPSRKL